MLGKIGDEKGNDRGLCKYLDSVDERTRKKLLKALDGLRELKGDIVKLKGHPNHYRPVSYTHLTLPTNSRV